MIKHLQGLAFDKRRRVVVPMSDFETGMRYVLALSAYC